MKKVLFIIGTRPEMIKLYPLLVQMQAQQNHFNVEICVTGQHKEMLAPFLQLFNCVPNYQLELMQQQQTLTQLAGHCLLRLDPILQKNKYDIIVVQGDTSTATMGALAGFYHHIPVAHVEAGLRTQDQRHPFPEEVNRQLIGVFARWHFAPTQLAMDNLLRENVHANSIHLVGNTIVDALEYVKQNYLNVPQRVNQILLSLQKKEIQYVAKKPFVLVTTHRRENFGVGLKNICLALKTLAQKNSQLDFIVPVHLNPQVSQPVQDLLSAVPNIILSPPLDYLELLFLLAHCAFVITDSGGIQEEAPSFGKFVLILREKTERPEAITAGSAKLIGTELETIIYEAQYCIDNPQVKKDGSNNPFGDGRAASRIVEILK